MDRGVGISEAGVRLGQEWTSLEIELERVETVAGVLTAVSRSFSIAPKRGLMLFFDRA